MYHNLEISELISFTKNLKVLYVEDNKDVRESSISLLQNFFDDIVIAIDGLDGLNKFKNDKFDLVISDIKMPKMNGVQMIKEIKKLDKSVSVIITTAHTETDFLIDSIQSGVDRYMLKPLGLDQIQEIVMQVCEKIYYIKKNKEYEESLEELVEERTQKLEEAQKKLLSMANKDYMTDLYNRRYFNDVSQTLIKLLHRDKKAFSLLMIDIDKFKLINDNYGHINGDKIIMSVAHTLLLLTRGSDIVVRFGGDEFVVILLNTKIQEATLVANKIRIQISNKEIDFIDKSVMKFTVSIGVAESDYVNDKDIDSLLHKADTALYESKRNGKNQVSVYDSRSM